MKRTVRRIPFYILIFAVAGISGQPAQVPQLQPPAFNSQNLDPYFSEAQGAQSQSAWESIIQNGLAGLRSAWETTVNAQINAELMNVTQSDVVNSQAEYQNYVQGALLSQMSSAEANWVTAAQATISAQRQTFIAALSAKDVTQAQQDAQNQTAALVAAGNPDQPSSVFSNAAQTVADAKAAYEKDFKSQLTSGLTQFNQAQGALDQNFTSFLSGLNQTDQEYQTNLQNMQAAEGNVRNAIGTQVQGMQSYLQSSQLFYNTVCDAQGNNCNAVMNQAGTDLLSVITNMQTALQQNAPLSQLTQTMVDYLTAQQTAAYTTEQTWQAQIDVAGDSSQTILSTTNPGPCFCNGFTCMTCSNWDNPFALNQQVVAMDTAIQSGDFSALDLLVGGGNGKTVQYTSMSLCASNGVCDTDYNLPANFDTLSLFKLSMNGGMGGGWEPGSVQKNLTYTIHDANAAANAATWGGYKNDLTGALNTFTALNTATNNWETQVNQYQSQYAAWITTAQQDLLTEQQSYAAASAQLSQTKNAWLQQMTDAHSTANIKWQSIAVDLAAAQNATQGGDAKSQQEAANSVLAKLPGYASVQQPNLTDLAAIVNSVSSNAPASGANASQGVPDFSLISNLGSQVGQTLDGLSNLAVAQNLSSDAMKAKSDALLGIANAAAGQNGTAAQQLAYSQQSQKVQTAHPDWSSERVEAQVKADLAGKTFTDEGFSVTTTKEGVVVVTRMVASGQAVCGGDPTMAADYHPVLQQQSIYISAPETMKLAETGSLFTKWDRDAVASQSDSYQTKLNESVGDSLTSAFTKANDVVSENIGAYMKSAQEQASKAAEAQSQVKSLLTTLLTGGTVQSWAQGQVRGQIADALSAATGFPAGFLSGLMGGMKPHEAVESFAMSLAVQNLGNAIGSQDLASMFQTQIQQGQANKARNKSTALHPEDLIPGVGLLTYTMRNAQYNPGLAKIDNAISSVPILGAAWKIGDSMYQASLNGKGLGGALQAGLDGVVGVVTSLGNAVGSMLKGDFKAEYAHLGAALTGVPTDKLMKDFGAKKPDDIAKLGEYTGLSVLAKDIKIATKVYGGMAKDIANQIQYNTLKGAADLSGNEGLKEKMKMKANGDYAASSDFTKNMDLGARGGLVSMAFSTGNPFLGLATAAVMSNDKVFGRITRGLKATYTKYPMLMDATAGLVGGGGGLYAGWKVREGWIRGGDKGALVAAGSLALQAIPGFAAAGGSAGAATQSIGEALSNLSARTVLQSLSGSMSYTRESGFSASIGLSPPGGKAGIALSYNDHDGLGLSLSSKVAGGLGLSVGISARGGLTGGGSYSFANGVNVGASYSRDSGFGANASYAFGGGKTDTLPAMNASFGISQRGGMTAGLDLKSLGGRASQLGLGLNVTRAWDGSTSASASLAVEGANLGSITDHGEMTLNQNFTQDLSRNREAARLDEKLRAKQGARAIEALGYTMTPEEWASLPRELQDSLLEQNHDLNIETANANGTGPGKGMNESWGEGIWDQFTSNLYSGVMEIAGGAQASNQYGWIDATGEYHDRTCFVKGTLVKTANGFVPIERIRPGDRVLAWSERTGELTYSKVQQTFIRKADVIYKIQYEDGTVVETTWSHPFYIAGMGWVKGKNLRAGMKSPTIAAIAKQNERVAMSGGYRLPVQTVSFLDNNTGKRSASVLLPEELPGAQRIASIEVIPGSETVYNFSVEETDDYFVGESGVLVHNQKYLGTVGTTAFYLTDDGEVVSFATGELGSSGYDGVDLFFDIITFGSYSAARTTVKAGKEVIEEVAEQGVKGIERETVEQATRQGVAGAVREIGKDVVEVTASNGNRLRRLYGEAGADLRKVTETTTEIGVKSNDLAKQGVNLVQKVENNPALKPQTFGSRNVDLYDQVSGRAIEVKNSAGRAVGLDSRIKEEVAKDVALMKAKGTAYKPEWHFTGRGPSKGLRELLEKEGIPIVVYK